jgi:two-component system chemotaxis response regulator CheY
MPPERLIIKMAKKALIVDDSRSMRQMVAVTLKSAGFELVEGQNGQEALDSLLDAGKVDLIVTDINMPVMDGITFVKEVRRLPSGKFTPILILTTESGDDMKARGKAAGATAWIVKPFRPDILLQVVSKVVSA